MRAYTRQHYEVRRAEEHEAALIGSLRLGSLICLEMPENSLADVRAVMSGLPDCDPELIRAGRYLVAEQDGDLIGGAGWSVLPLSFRADALQDSDGRPGGLSLDTRSVLIRGFFLDPDLGRRGAGASVIAAIEEEIAQAGYSCAELIVPAAAQVYYRSLGFRPVAKLALQPCGGNPLPMLQMRKCLPVHFAAAA